MDYSENATSVLHWIEPLQPFLDRDGVFDVAVNRPGEAFIYSEDGCHRHVVPEMTLARCMSLATAVATYNGQSVSEQTPLLEATLPGGQRLGLVLPTACTANTVAFVIRRPPGRIITLDEMEVQGLFSRVVADSDGLQEHERHLLELKRAGRLKVFLTEAMRYGKFIVAAGHTGCGKTTIARALAEFIPADKRVITIESTAEMNLPNHANAVHLFWSEGGQSIARVTPPQLLGISLRLRPDAILYAEVRGAECLNLVEAGESGHRWCMTTLHASSPAGAVDRMVMMCLRSPAAQGMNYVQLKRMILRTVDVIVQFGNDDQGRFIQSVWYDPLLKQRLANAGVAMGLDDAADREVRA